MDISQQKELDRINRRKKLNGFKFIQIQSYNSGDCVVRSMALALDIEYKESYELLKEFIFSEEDYGVLVGDYAPILQANGWKFTILEADYVSKRKLPKTPCLVVQEDHLVYINDGKLYDAYNVGSLGLTNVLGYFTRNNAI